MVIPMQTRADVLRIFSRSQFPPPSNSWACTAADTTFKSCARNSLELWELLLSHGRRFSGFSERGKDGT